MSPPASPPEAPPWLIIIAVLAALLACVIIAAICWKVGDRKRIFAPRLRKTDEDIAQFFTPMSNKATKKETEAEGQEELAINPIVQARLMMEEAVEGNAGGRPKKSKMSHGALRKLNLDFGPKKTNAKKDALRKLDKQIRKS